MLPDEENPIAETEAQAESEAPAETEQAVEPAEEAPLTKEVFLAQIQRLSKRAKAAGWSPLRTMAQTYVKRGMAVIEGLLVGLENEASSKKKK